MSEIKLVNRTLCMCIVFCCITLGVCFLYSIYGDDVVAKEYDALEELEADGSLHDGIFIPLPESYDEEVSVFCNVKGKEITVEIPNVEQSFYYNNMLSGNNDGIANLLYGYDRGSAHIIIQLSQMRECSWHRSDDGVIIKIIKPDEYYKYVVVLDPAFGGGQLGTVSYDIKEVEVNYNFARILQDELMDRGIGCYLTKDVLEENPDDAEREAFYNEINGRLFVRLRCNADASTRVTRGVVVEYNNELLGSLAERFCDELRDNCGDVKVVKSQNYVYDIDCVTVKLGYLTNKVDALNLCDEAYLSQMAREIADGIEDYCNNEE